MFIVTQHKELSMLEKEVQKSIRDELKKVEHKIEKCLEDINNSASDANRDAVEMLTSLKQQQDELKNDLETSKSSDAGFWERLRLAAEAFVRESSEKIDNLLLSKKIKDIDMVNAGDAIKFCGESLVDYQVEVEIVDLKSIADEVMADRKITVTHVMSGKNRVYKAGFNESSIWQDELKNDIQSGYFK